MKDKNYRKQLRLKEYDYHQNGLYFVTICSQNRFKYFGDIIDKRLLLNSAGEKINNIWLEMTDRFTSFQIHQSIIMPNHLHSIVEIQEENDISLGEFVGAFKSLSTNAYIQGVKEQGWVIFEKRLWQRNYYEHVIRDETSYSALSDYIENNPLRWDIDRFFA